MPYVQLHPGMKYKIVGEVQRKREEYGGQLPRGFLTYIAKIERIETKLIYYWLKKDDNGEDVSKNKIGPGRKNLLTS